MPNVLGPDQMRLLLKRWLRDEIKRAGGPKALALELRRAGYPEGSAKPFGVRAIQVWQDEGRRELPHPTVVWAISQLTASSQDAAALEGPLKRSLAERLQDHEARVGELERLVAELTTTDRTRLDTTAAALVVLGKHVGFDVLDWVRRAHRGEEPGERAEGC